MKGHRMYASGAASSIALLSIAATCVLASYEPFQSLVARTSTAVAKKFPQLMSGGSPPFLLEICGGIGARCSSSYDLLHMLHAACCMPPPLLLGGLRASVGGCIRLIESVDRFRSIRRSSSSGRVHARTDGKLERHQMCATLAP